ncbi:MAG: DUF1343 domain-containing protein [candidate division WOR-3 bacterium]|nr:DUF1343 domain-containing protein [candidate division WOR-3 bacterium]
MELGIDILIEDRFSCLRNKKIALLTNISATDKKLNPTFYHFINCEKFQLKFILAPEHGLFSALQDQVFVKNRRSERIPVLSIYGKNLTPPVSVLKEVDVVVVDLIDIGTRYYTFVWSAVLLLRKLAQLNKKLIILDRPNPLNGITIQGPVLEKRFISFVGLFPLPVRHGLTIGEICRMVSIEENINSALEVVKMKGWRRRMYFPECNLKWTVPSPNMPSFETALVYPGMCLLEGTNVSEGRGTTRPFEIFGAPWIDEEEVVKELNNRYIKGVAFRPLKFIPTFHKYCGAVCGGAQIYVIDLKKFDPIITGLEVISTIKRFYPEKFSWRKPPYEFEKEKMPFDILIGNSWVRKSIEQDEPVHRIERRWQEGLQAYKKRHKEFLLYD